MSLFNLLNVAGSAMDAQSVRLNLTASNLANADTVGHDANSVYKPKRPVFAEVLEQTSNGVETSSVKVTDVVESDEPARKRYQPHHPSSDAEGYVWAPNIDVVEEMADMISASRSYQANVEVANTTKDLALQTLNLGR